MICFSYTKLKSDQFAYIFFINNFYYGATRNGVVSIMYSLFGI